jgi:toxin ParE1/3/4
VSARYLIRPKADQDLEEQSLYYALRARPELGHRFLLAAHETFALLVNQPAMGWQAHWKTPALKSVRIFPIAGFDKILVLYRPLEHRVEILRVIHGSRNLRALLRREGLAT